MPNMFEALFILALDEDEGYIVESALENLQTALAGAVLAEMALQERIELKNGRVVVSNQECTGHPILDKTLNDILDETRLRKPRYWINTLAYKNLLKEIGHDLVDQRVLSRHKKRLRLAVISDEGQAPVPSLKYSIKSHLREIVLAGGQPNLADQVLLAFSYYADLLRLVFTVGERKIASKAIKKLLKNGGLSETLKTIVAAACER
jgi:golgi phosphoprotein 3